MELRLERRWKKECYTIGILYIEGMRFCETLECKVRIGPKVYGKTAIPAGRYKIDMNTVSPKFKERAWARPYAGKIPRLVDVPGFQGVLIHPGNTAADTLGCILVGNNKARGKVLDSTIRFRQLMDEFLLPAQHSGDDITILID